MSTVHWLGAGLSSVPGIRRLASGGQNLILWNRTLQKAQEALAGLEGKAQARALDWQALESAVEQSDIVVSMLPGTFHVEVAELCLRQKAHFVSSSYISPEMQALHERALASDRVFVNEVGLDPGLDHLLAHSLVDQYRQSAAFDPANSHYFRSYCGGFPKVPNEFTYKFSWSPLGVLKALTSEARWQQGGEEQRIATPWKAVSDYTATFANGQSETFQAYPNRDSLPFMQQYGFAENWNVQEFVRGTLRLNGWSQAWQYLFDEIETLEGASGEERLQALSDDLWQKYTYDDGEADRVVLCVELEVRDPSGENLLWHKSYDLDEYGNERGSAMARLVSLTVSLAIDAIHAGELPAGVSPAPDAEKIVSAWLGSLRDMGEQIPLSDRV